MQARAPFIAEPAEHIPGVISVTDSYVFSARLLVLLRHKLWNLAGLMRRAQQGHRDKAVIPQRCRPVRVADHAHKPLDIGRKSRCTVTCPFEIHRSPHMLIGESPQLPDSPRTEPATF